MLKVKYDSNGFRIREEGVEPYWSRGGNARHVKRIPSPHIIPEARFKRDIHMDKTTGMLVPIMVQTNRRSIEAANKKIMRNASYRIQEQQAIKSQLALEAAA